MPVQDVVRKEATGFLSENRRICLLGLFLGLVSLHSLVLGVLIYFFTEAFYNLFFLRPVENMFFVRQAGLFLVCLGTFYGASLACLKERFWVVPFIVASKVLAVVFLTFNASLSARPEVVRASAAVDGVMACSLLFLYLRARNSLNGESMKGRRENS